MRANIQQITKALSCTEDHALNVERYMDKANMVNWSEASKRLINAIAKAVSDKLIRDARATIAPVIADAPVVVKAKAPKAKAPKAPKAKAPKAKALVTSNRAALALVIFKRYEGCSRQEMITYIVSEMASLHGVELTRHQAAGQYQNCKKKAGA